MAKKLALTVQEWEDFGRRCREARVLTDKLVREFPPTSGLNPSHIEGFMKVSRKLISAAIGAERALARQHPALREAAFRILHGPDGTGVYWSRCTGRVKRNERTLSRAEWVEWGSRVKLLREQLFVLLGTLAGSVPKTENCLKRISGTIKLLDRARSPFDDLVCRQHPDWKDAIRCFYGPEQARCDAD